MEQVLHLINNMFVSLDGEEVKESNALIKSKIEKLLIPKMKDNDPLFKDMYNTIAYGGSFYDGLKVGKPDEFDLDIKLSVPKCSEHNVKKCKQCVEIIPCSEAPGFVYFKVKETISEKFNSFLEDEFMQNNRVIKEWFKGLVNISLNQIKQDFLKQTELHNVIIKKEEEEKKPGSVEYFSESGPAVTLRVSGKFGYIDIDLVPAFEFDTEKWPMYFQPNPSKEKNVFLVVPKKLNNTGENCEIYWRASFQEQERELIHHQERLKPALRLLKKLRTSHHESIPSYALKTLVLWDLEHETFDYSKKSLSDCFLYLVNIYKGHLEKQEIPYYWKCDNNLLQMKNIHSDTLKNHHNHISKIVKNLVNDPANPYIIAKLILKDGTEEYDEIISVMKEKDDIFHISDYVSYGNIEPYLHVIATEYLKPEEDNLATIKTFVRNRLLKEMRNGDPLFYAMCSQKIFFHDSYFTGLEHNLYIELKLPKCEMCRKRYCSCVTINQLDQYLLVKIEQCYSHSWNKFASKKFLRGDYILTWLNELINLTLEDMELPNEIQSCRAEYSDDTQECCSSTPDFKNGPTLTLVVLGDFGVLRINIVPALIFTYDHLPASYRCNPTEDNNSIYVIPVQNGSEDKRLWWPCLYDQEKRLLKDKQRLNIVIRLLKKSRKNLGHRLIPDYAIRTMFLWDVKMNKFDYNKSLGDAFMYMIQKYAENLGEKLIRYYWKNTHIWNVLDSEKNELNEYSQKIKKQISEFKNACQEHPEFVAKLILGSQTKEYLGFIQKVNKEDDIAFQQSSFYGLFEDTDSGDDDSSEEWPDQTFGFGNNASSSSGSSFRSPYSNDESATERNGRFAYIEEGRRRNNEIRDQMTVDDSVNGWAVAAGVVGVAAVVGLGIWGAISHANRNNNRRQ